MQLLLLRVSGRLGTLERFGGLGALQSSLCRLATAGHTLCGMLGYRVPPQMRRKRVQSGYKEWRGTFRVIANKKVKDRHLGARKTKRHSRARHNHIHKHHCEQLEA